jgi:plastocyanin
MVWQRSRLALCAWLLCAAAAIGCGNGSGNNNNPVAPSGSGGGSGGGSGSAASLVITITGMNGSNSFSPNPATVRVGQTVAWRNADAATHTATANAGGFDTGNIAAGATSAPITVGAAGGFDYHCGLHPTMVGTLNVTP